MRDAFAQSLIELAEEFPELLVLDGDVANSTRVDRFARACPRQFVEAGIAEQNMAGVAAGLATMGFIPMITTFSVFATSRDLDQVRMLISQNRLNVKIVGAYSGLLTGKTGKTHICIDDLAVFRVMPHMTVLAPADEVELRAMLRWMLQTPGPAYIRVARDPGHPVFVPPTFRGEYRLVVGGGIRLVDGKDLTVVSTGVQTSRCLEAVNFLRERGICARFVHVPALKPMDPEALLEAIGSPPLVVTVEEHSVIGGLGGAIAELLSEHRPAPLLRIGLQDCYGESGPNEALLDKYGLSARRIASQIEQAVVSRRRNE